MKSLPGNPDLAFPKQKIAIFINGCFFHRHENCKQANTPKDNEKFWLNKISLNVLRDKRNIESLKQQNWTIYIIWECEIEPRKKKSQLRNATLEDLKSKILKKIHEENTSN